MDPRQRSSDRRFFKAVAVWLVIGVGFIGAGLAFVHVGADIWDSGRRQVPLAGLFLVGSGMLASGVWSLGRRVVKGPDKPGKRARY